MDAKLEERFEEIAQSCVEEAETVECEGKDFVEGLKIIVSSLRHRLEAAVDEFGE